MKIKRLFFFLLVAIVSWGELLSAQPAKDDAINLPFTGVYRAGAKTSIARTNHKTAPVTKYANLSALLATLPPDNAMRSRHPALKPGQHNAPSQRFPEEQRNVRISDCWILVVKYEKSKITKTKTGKTKRTGDNDFHLVVSSTPQMKGGQRMNMEVAGLPPNGGPDVNKLRQARADFLSMCAKLPAGGRFVQLALQSTWALKVHYFSMESTLLIKLLQPTI